MKHYMKKIITILTIRLTLTACTDDTPDYSVPAVSDIST